jgi:hypothetical protein
MSPLPIKTGVIEPGSSGSIELSALECNKISAHYKLAESGMSHGGEFVWYKASYRRKCNQPRGLTLARAVG